MHLFKHYERDEAQGLVEYSFILVMVAMAAVAALALLGTTVYEFFDEFIQWIGQLIGG